MGDGQFLDIILFAMIAAFLVLRLRSVLGRRTGHERPPPADPFARRRAEAGNRTKPGEDRATGDDNVVALPDRQGGEATGADPLPSDPLAAGLTQIGIADPSFDAAGFLAGARAAFETIVQAYARGEAKMLRTLLNDEVYERFSNAMAEREKTGETLDTTLIGIASAELIEARMENRTAFVTVKFVSEQVNVTRDNDGTVIDGDPSHVTNVTDIWTFARNTRARDPNWTLVETQSPN
jgi:predicted lipid-binding transport protein (Tim44 family)